MKTTNLPTPYNIYPRFLVTHETQGSYRTTLPSVALPEEWSYGLQFINDTESTSASGKKKWSWKHKWVIIGGVVVLVAAASSQSQNSEPVSSTAAASSVPQTSLNAPTPSNAVPTMSLDGLTFNLYSLASLQTADLQYPSSPPTLIQTTGTITKFLSGSLMVITDGNGNYGLVFGNDGSNANDHSPLVSTLNVGDSITASGMYGGQANNTNYQNMFPSSISPSTPVIFPLDDADDLKVLSVSQSSETQSWQQVFSYTSSPTDTRVNSGDPAVPSFTVGSDHWRILWQVSGSNPVEQGVNWSINGWLASSQNDSDGINESVFDQQLANGASASGAYNGVGAGTYYLSYDLGIDNVLNFTVEELK